MDPADPLSAPVDPPRPAGQTLDAATIERVVAAHRAGLKRTCWEREAEADPPRSASATISLTIGTDGRVTQASSTGDSPAIAKCIESQTRTWLFPAPVSQTTVTIPFKFVRQ